MSVPLVGILDQIRAVGDEMSRVLTRVTKTSEDISKKSTPTLIGALGGLIGWLVAYLFNLAFNLADITLLVLLPCIGIFSAILYTRRDQFATERALARFNSITALVKKDLKALPIGSPKGLRQNYFLLYNAALENLMKSIPQGAPFGSTLIDQLLTEQKITQFHSRLKKTEPQVRQNKKTAKSSAPIEKSLAVLKPAVPITEVPPDEPPQALTA